jgi:hypothetical protein
VGTSKDPDRPLLHAIHVKENFLETTDGFRIHRVFFRSQEERTLPEGLLQVVSISKRVVIFEVMPPGKYPDCDAIWRTKVKPMQVKEFSNECIAFFMISPDLVSTSLKFHNTRGTKIEIGSGPFIITFPTELGGYAEMGVSSIQALIMPVHGADGCSGLIANHEEVQNAAG